MISKNPPKLENVRDKAIQCIQEGLYRYTAHGQCRKFERQITEQDALYVIKNGWRAQDRDKYFLEYKSWTYAFEGNTLQEERLRIIVGFDEDMMLIITVMHILKRN